ncbi:kinase-like protein [Piedraia hortae CBS 480.64]|uniref:Kinase-like protein n=1 Tax=Piedraia hortae CBS 480.64 TaxID=1314780 RepID=A0A6A7C6L4_9PEZI|nr:kinase-like protein [Piedraia hortae CBS 480.64]
MSSVDQRSSSPAERYILHDNESIRIIKHLDPEILELTKTIPGSELTHVDPTDPVPLPDGFAASFNDLLRGDVLHELAGMTVVSLGTRYVVRISSSLDQDYIDNMKYIHDTLPSFPTPRCLGVIATDLRTYLFMTRAEGKTLESTWPYLSIADKVSVQKQLEAVLQPLRDLRFDREQHSLGSFGSGLCKDVRRKERVSESRIWSEDEFNDFLCFSGEKKRTQWMEMIRTAMGDGSHRIVATHGDLHPRNIMVTYDGTGAEGVKEGSVRVSALIDWDAAGWYPEHWEFVKALGTTTPRGLLRDWINYIPYAAIGRYVPEYGLDCVLDRWLG